MDHEVRIVSLEVTQDMQTKTLQKMADAFEKLLVIEQNQLHAQEDNKLSFNRAFTEIEKIDGKFDRLSQEVQIIQTKLPHIDWATNLVHLALLGAVSSIAYYIVTKVL